MCDQNMTLLNPGPSNSLKNVGVDQSNQNIFPAAHSAEPYNQIKMKDQTKIPV